MGGPQKLLSEGLTPRLTGAGARSAQGTNIGHKNGEAMANVGVRVEPLVRRLRAMFFKSVNSNNLAKQLI